MNSRQAEINAKEQFGTTAVSSFEAVDPYNKGCTVSGWLCRAEGPFFGSLLITHVNDVEAHQLIRGTPKIGYPFDKNGRWTFPSAQKIDAFEKLDGTNILQFRYFDGNNFPHTSYKTRLLPFLKDGGRFGDFKSMWDRILEMHPRIPELWAANRCNVSFELYGSVNPHLILYDVPLATAVLFGITNGGDIKSPLDMDLLDVPSAPHIMKVDGQYVETYQWQKSEMQGKLEVIVDGESYKGLEGQVWYLLLEDNRVMQFKCKPDEIESIHFAMGKRLSKTTVMATCWKALENLDLLNYDIVVSMLCEDYPPDLVSLSKDFILDCVKKVQRDLEFRDLVVERYKATDKSILGDKHSVMRLMSQHFPKDQMTRVYNAIMAYETVGRW